MIVFGDFHYGRFLFVFLGAAAVLIGRMLYRQIVDRLIGSGI